MNEKDLINFIHEVMDERATYAAGGLRKRKAKSFRKRPMQTSKAIIFFASVMYALTWLVAVYSWFYYELVVPVELMKYSTY